MYSKKVINWETKKVYSSISEVCRNYNLKYSTLSRQLNGGFQKQNNI